MFLLQRVGLARWELVSATSSSDGMDWSSRSEPHKARRLSTWGLISVAISVGCEVRYENVIGSARFMRFSLCHVFDERADYDP